MATQRGFKIFLRALDEFERVDTESKTKTLTEDKGVSMVLIRDTFTKESIIVKMYVDREMFCNTLELPFKDNHSGISRTPIG